ncbi:dihydrofolate reductase [Corynebacterium caspium]|uniref:dihydrofolate reductase n=1 Tax=Corynebacterium caspium TaxID=234828 RepID=UPI00037924E6|nr:dihydrofolate reductase [Corynebacterium caspium]WKD59647.1 Dihydrofolate reductase [Corynebacterium caspium DSM 44850]
MLGAIWAQSIDGVIGDGKTMPWHLPEDLAHFKETTMDATVIMGRKTWESLPFKPLPGRQNLVISKRDPGKWSTGATVIRTLPQPLEGWIIGGGKLYKSTINQADFLYITLVDAHLRPTMRERAVLAPKIPAAFYCTTETDWQESATGRLLEGLSPVPLRYKFMMYSRRSTA